MDATQQNGVISKESAMKLGLVIVLLGGAVAVSAGAGRVLALAERTSSDIAEIKVSIKEIVTGLNLVNTTATRNAVEIESLKNQTRPR